MYKYSTFHTKREIVLDKDITKAKEKYFYISSLAKGIKVLELLAEKGDLSVTDVAKQLGINRAASHRFIFTLRELGYVEKNDHLQYGLTFKIFELGMKVVNRFEIRRTAPPFMQKLASLYNETVNFACLDNEELSLGLRCVGAPILDHSGYPRYAMSVSGVAIRMPPVKIKQIQEGVRKICSEFSSKLKN
jgi:DNA-binding IclR family transcriptional regulator